MRLALPHKCCRAAVTLCFLQGLGGKPVWRQLELWVEENVLLVPKQQQPEVSCKCTPLAGPKAGGGQQQQQQMQRCWQLALSLLVFVVHALAFIVPVVLVLWAIGMMWVDLA